MVASSNAAHDCSQPGSMNNSTSPYGIDAESNSWSALKHEVTVGRLDHATFGNFGLDDLVYQTPQEAEAARVVYLNYRQAIRVYDHTMPRNDDDRRVIVVKLVRALVSKQSAQDGEKKIKVWENHFIMHSKYANPKLVHGGKELMERTAWVILSRIESYHRDQRYPPHTTPRQGPGAFLQHVEDVCEALYERKTLADRAIGVLGPDDIERFVGNVKDVVETVRLQKIQNDTRAAKLKAMKAGAQTQYGNSNSDQNTADEASFADVRVRERVSTAGHDGEDEDDVVPMSDGSGEYRSQRMQSFDDMDAEHPLQAISTPHAPEPNHGPKRKQILQSDEDMSATDSPLGPAKKQRQAPPTTSRAESNRANVYPIRDPGYMSNLLEYVPPGVEDLIRWGVLPSGSQTNLRTTNAGHGSGNVPSM